MSVDTDPTFKFLLISLAPKNPSKLDGSVLKKEEK